MTCKIMKAKPFYSIDYRPNNEFINVFHLSQFDDIVLSVKFQIIPV